MECFVGLDKFSPARRGIFPDSCPREGSMQCKNPDGDPESLGPYLISWSNMVVPIPVSSV